MALDGNYLGGIEVYQSRGNLYKSRHVLIVMKGDPGEGPGRTNDWRKKFYQHTVTLKVTEKL